MDTEHLLTRWREAFARPVVGWDFSDIEGLGQSDPPAWYDVWAGRALAGATAVLDMGTGGGEVLLDLAARHPLPADTVATEGWAPNVPVAAAALAPHGVTVVEHDSETDPFPFPDARFDCVLNRHESYVAAEVARVLRPGGRFLTQQVDCRNMVELAGWFDFTPVYQHVRLDLATADAESAGLEVVASDEWTGELTFRDVESLMGYVRMVPWEVPDDFSVDAYAPQLLEQHHRATGRALVFSERRFILACRRPAR